MTAPLVPPDIVIPRLPWVPVYADRLWESEFWAIASDSEKVAAFCLWLKSWTQTPPGSLPSDDRLLCRLAELNGNLAKWKKVKKIALKNWILCEDDRLYHPVVAELVIDAAHKLNAKLQRMANARAARRSNNKANDKAYNKANNLALQYSTVPIQDSTIPSGPARAREGSSSLDERALAALEEERRLYEAVNEMRYSRADAYRAGKLKAWDAENGAKLTQACERLAELKTANGEEPAEPLKPLGAVVDTVVKYPTHQWAQPKPAPFAEQPVHTPRPRGRPRKDTPATKPMFDA